MVNEYVMDFKTFKKLRKVCRSSGIWLVLNIIWLILFAVNTVATVCLAAWYISLGISISSNIYILGLISLFSGFRAFFYHPLVIKTQFKSFSKFLSKEEWLERFEISEDKITITEESSISNFYHIKIRKIVERENIIMIEYDGNVQFCMLKDGFVSGCWEDCKKLLLSKNPNIKVIEK